MRLPSPQRLGLPDKFVKWRLHQERAILDLLDSELRFDGISAPTGSGKSLTAIGLALLLPRNERVLILTSTKALQDQVHADFESVGLRDIRGKRNYRCIAASSGGELANLRDEATSDGSYVSVEHGPCFTAAAPCSLRDNGCEWFDKLRSARSARIVSTNYAKWISTTPDKALDELGKFDWLICDEAADAEQHLTDALHVELRKSDVESLLRLAWPAPGTSGAGATRIQDWREWAQHHRGEIERAVLAAEGALRDAMAAGRSTKDSLRRLAGLRELAQAFTSLRTMRGDWVLDDLRVYDRVIGVSFDPIWPSAYAEGLLFRGIPRVVMMAATLVEKHLDILGVPRIERAFTSYPSTFPVARRPVIFVKLDAGDRFKLNYLTERDESTQRKVVAIGDAITAGRLDRNGLTHTVSYKRASYISRLSEHRDIIIGHTSDDASKRAALKRFKDNKDRPPWRLDSPAVGTGADFPGTEAEYCWIPKLPFEPEGALLKARCNVDPQYRDFKVACDVTQFCGRGMRSASDGFESLVSDPLFGWHPWRHRELYSKYFLDSIRVSNGVPRPPPKLSSGRSP